MYNPKENLQPQFSGFFNTPHLFTAPILGMSPFLKTCINTPVFKDDVPVKTRLGKRVERYVGCEMSHVEELTILVENCQIQTEDNRTVGEIDCLVLDEGKPVHVEIQFKYYIYDESLGTTEIDHCIGPMRRDSLNEKLSKLKNKQLPLLYRPETKAVLDNLNLKAEDFKQQIYFKAQLFMPYGKTVVLKTLNPECVYGVYFKYDRLHEFKDYKFYIPKKQDWLLDVTPHISWKTYTNSLEQLNTFKFEGYAPLVWLKAENGVILKCFIVA